MNYIQKAYKGHYEWWRYLVGVLVTFISWQIIGAIPFMAALFIKSAKQGDMKILENLDSTTMMKILESNTTLFFMLLSFVFGLIGLFLVVKFLHKLSITHLTTARNKVDWYRILFAFTLWGCIVVGMTLLAYYISPDDFLWNFNMNKFLVLAIIAIILIPLQTSFEEYLFRGYLMQGLGVIVKNKWFPLLMTSFVFGMMHFWNPEVDKLGPIIMVYYIGTGLFLGIITLMDDGIELALGFHAANNLFTALLVTTDWTVFQTHSILRDTSEPSAGLDILFPVLVLFPILLVVFSKKYGWTNWKEKLTGKIDEVILVEK